MIMATTSKFKTKDPAQAARDYADFGWYVLPVYPMVAGVCGCGERTCSSPGKHPMVVNGLTSATNDRDDLAEWFYRHPNSNIGVRTGTISGFIAIDIDVKNDGDKSLDQLIAEHGPLPKTVQARTGGGGSHYLFACPRFTVKNSTNLRPGIDVRGDGGYIVVAPSRHQSGNSYEWVDGHAPDEIDLAYLPDWLAQKLRPENKQSVVEQSPVQLEVEYAAGPDDEDWRALIGAGRQYIMNIDGVGEGERNGKTFNVAGHLAAFRLRNTSIGLSEDDVRGLVVAWNQKNHPPLSDREVQQVVRSAFNNGTPRDIKWIDMPGTQPATADEADDTGEERTSTATRLVELARSEHDLFHSHGNSDETFATMRVNGETRTFRLDSTDYARRLRHRYYERYRVSPNDTGVTEAIKTLQGIALYDSPAKAVFTRLGWSDDAVYLDLADEGGHIVEITAEGWQVVTETEIRFLRHPNMLPMPVPTDGELTDLRGFINTTDGDAWSLCASWLVMALMPKGPYPLLVLSGPQGSAKTTASRTLMKLIDPRKGSVRATPASNRDLAIAAQSAHVMAFDNLQRVQPWLSDGLCRLATGGGFATRKLYTNDEEAVFEACRPIILNGIDAVATAPDLLDRSLLVELKPIAPENRMTEKVYWQVFDGAYPQLLAGLCDAVAMAMAKLEAVAYDDLPRMADAARWAIAAAPALGLDDEAFMRAYSGQQHIADLMALEAAPIGEALSDLIDTQLYWEGTASELLQILRARNDDMDRRFWPTSATAIGKQLTRLEPILNRNGYNVMRERDATHERRRLIRLWRDGHEPNLEPLIDATRAAAMGGA